MEKRQKRVSSTSLGAAEGSLNDQDFTVAKSTSKKLFDGEFAYHVTNCCVDHYPEAPRIDQLKGNMATDTYYDGPLLGAVGVFFTTSLYSVTKGLPTISPYPTNGIAKQDYWRVRIPLVQFNNYDMSLVKQDKSQVMLLLTLGSRQTAQFRVHPGIVAIDPTSNGYLHRKDGAWRVSAYERNAGSDSDFDPYFVNFFLPTAAFVLSNVTWDKVTHRKPSELNRAMPLEEKVVLQNELWLAKALLVRNDDQEYADLCKTSSRLSLSMRPPSSSSLNLSTRTPSSSSLN